MSRGHFIRAHIRCPSIVNTRQLQEVWPTRTSSTWRESLLQACWSVSTTRLLTTTATLFRLKMLTLKLLSWRSSLPLNTRNRPTTRITSSAQTLKERSLLYAKSERLMHLCKRFWLPSVKLLASTWQTTCSCCSTFKRLWATRMISSNSVTSSFSQPTNPRSVSAII